MQDGKNPDAEARLQNEAQLLKEAQRGNSDAYGELYLIHAPVVYRFLVAHLNNCQDAEDLTTEVFLRAWKFLPDYRYEGVSFRAFLMRIAYNLTVDAFRKQKKEEHLPDDDLLPPKIDPGLIAQPLDERFGDRDDIFRLLWRLPQDYRTVLTARFLVDLTPTETARLMGRSEGAVRVLQHRALAALRKSIEES